jgi:hypothetical protein
MNRMSDNSININLLLIEILMSELTKEFLVIESSPNGTKNLGIRHPKLEIS